MKKTIAKFFSLIVAVTLLAGVFQSCGLVSVDVDRDMSQVIASVNVENTASEDIYKREMSAGFITYGYYYMQYYGYDTNQTYNLILNNLVNNKVIVQYARRELEEAHKTFEHSDEVKGYLSYPADKVRNAYAKNRIAYIDSIIKFVSDVQLAEAVYNSKNTLSNYVDSFETTDDEEEDEELEDESVTARATPSVDEVEGDLLDEEYVSRHDEFTDKTVEDDLTEAQKAEYEAWQIAKYTRFDILPSPQTTSRKKAVNEFIDTFVSNGLIYSDEKSKLEKAGGEASYDLTNYTYYLDLLMSNLESSIVDNYEEMLTDAAEAEINDDALWSEFKSAYETQKDTYTKDISAYASALESATDDSYILYNPEVKAGKFGYVANILIGFPDSVTAALNAYDSKANASFTKKQYRATLKNTIIAKDLRATWLQNGYYELKDGKEANGEDAYEFGDDYAKHLKSFYGTFNDVTDYTKTTKTDTYFYDEAHAGDHWAWGEKEEEDIKAAFKDIEPTEYTFEKFLELFDAEIGKDSENEGHKTQQVSNTDKVYDYKGQIKFNDNVKEIIDDLTFAFSTDTGVLSQHYGYLYSPISNSWVEEFAEGAKLVVNGGEDIEGGPGSYVIALTDYGYHIIICTKVVEPGDVYKVENDEGKAQFIKELEEKGTVAYRFKKAKKDANVQSLVSDVVTYNISVYVDEENTDKYAVKKYEKTFKNLIDSLE